MDMQAKHQETLIFHLTGRIVNDGQGASLQPIRGLGLCPALLAPYMTWANCATTCPSCSTSAPTRPSSCIR